MRAPIRFWVSSPSWENGFVGFAPCFVAGPSRNSFTGLRVPPGAFSIHPFPRAMFEQRPDVGAAAPASLTGKLRFQIRQPDIVGPAIGVDNDRMGATIVGAIDDKPGRPDSPLMIGLVPSMIIADHKGPDHAIAPGEYLERDPAGGS
jgi:hypothetical protein